MKLTSNVRMFLLCLVTACFVGGSVFAAGSVPSAEGEPAVAAPAIDETGDPVLSETVEPVTGLPEAPLHVAIKPISNQCPDECTGTSLSYVGPRDCYHDDCLHQCIVYRDNDTGRLCAQRCAAY